MLSALRPIHLSRIRRAVYTVCALVVSSYVFFDALDLDGSNSPRLFSPLQKTISVAEVLSEGELFTSPEPLALRDRALIPTTDQAGKLTSPDQGKLLILSPLFSARAHGYRVSLARNSLPDSSSYH